MDALAIADGSAVADIGAGAAGSRFASPAESGPTASSTRRTSSDRCSRPSRSVFSARASPTSARAWDAAAIPPAGETFDAMLIVDVVHEIEDRVTLFSNLGPGAETRRPHRRVSHLMLDMILMRLLITCCLRADGDLGAGIGTGELSIVEQRYQAVMAVLAGDPVTEVAARSGCRGRACIVAAPLCREGLAGLQDRSHRPDGCLIRRRRRWRRWCVSCAGTILSGGRGGSRSSSGGRAARVRCRRG